MRVLRSSLYPSMHQMPLTLVIRDSDVQDTLESIASHDSTCGALVVNEIFDMTDGSIVDATEQALERMDHERERHMSTLFHWTMSQWHLASEGGLIIMPRPAPLDTGDIRLVFEQLKDESDYKNFTIMVSSQDGTVVRLHQGEITDE